MITRWRTVPVEVEAVEWTGYPEDVRPLFRGAAVIVAADRRLWVPTLRGGRWALLGDWIVRTPDGELSIWPDPGFRAWHVRIDEQPATTPMRPPSGPITDPTPTSILDMT